MRNEKQLLDEKTRKTLDEIAVNILKGEFMVTDYRCTQYLDRLPEVEISVVTKKGQELTFELMGVK